MPQLDWSIHIKAAGTDAVAVEPQQPPPSPPRSVPTLIAQSQDVVSWGNQSASIVQPWVLNWTGTPLQPLPSAANAAKNPNGQGLAGYLCDPIAPNNSSQPQYIAPPTTGASVTRVIVSYCCLLYAAGSDTPVAIPLTGLGAIEVISAL